MICVVDEIAHDDKLDIIFADSCLDECGVLRDGVLFSVAAAHRERLKRRDPIVLAGGMDRQSDRTIDRTNTSADRMRAAVGEKGEVDLRGTRAGPPAVRT